jgi:molybdate transport system ATP-binding protein/molybdate/tungstate transport system ATP-binding protein
VTPENLFRVDLPAGNGMKHVRVGAIEIAVLSERTGPVVLAVPPTDIFVSRQPVPSSARNVFSGRVTGMAIDRRGAGVHVTADVGVELVAVVTAEAARDLAIAPGAPVVFAFKASAVQVF